ncbi:MAG: DUF6174 domain-containing protein [Gemmatimonadota bacterium]
MKSRSTHRTWFRCSLLVVAVAVAACSNPLAPERDELNAARALWAANAPDAYAYRFQRLCFCGSEVVRGVRIEVAGGQVVSVVPVDDGPPLQTPIDEFPTIDDLFDEILSAIEAEADQLLATYNAELGYPVDVAIDFIFEAIDEEMAFEVREFTPSPSP